MRPPTPVLGAQPREIRGAAAELPRLGYVARAADHSDAQCLRERQGACGDIRCGHHEHRHTAPRTKWRLYDELSS